MSGFSRLVPENKKVKIMLVDDEEGIRETVSIILQRAGYDSIQHARTGEECVRLVKAGFRGLLLMDVMMPGLDGWDTIRALAKENLMDGNLICMLTAIRDPDHKSEGLEQHVIDYLPKPFTVPALLKVVENSAQFLTLAA